ncbi:hypothetical protein [Kribbella deserti]|uniref:Protein RecA n=1 Tax=Kribbella deserti TaxID=1926257 RepID=A0ABV6QL16_9ACTN
MTARGSQYGHAPMDQARALLARAREQKAARLAAAASDAVTAAASSASGGGGQQVAVVPGGVMVPRNVPAPRTTETRVQQALDTAAQDRTLPTLPAVSELLLGGSLRGGAAYSVRGSTSLVMAMMAGPSAEGAWCGVVGLPTFGAEAARGLGVDLDRLVLVPEPEQDWLSVVAALVDALTVVVVRPPGVVTPGEASRLSARLRSRGAVLISVGAWPGSDARFEVQGARWTGLELGHGRLLARQATIAVTGRGSAVRPHRHLLWLPAEDGSVQAVDPVVGSATAPVDGAVAELAGAVAGPVWQQEAAG